MRLAAREFGVDARVVLAAYRELEDQGLVELRTRSGVFVASTAASESTDVESRAIPAERHTDWLIDQFADSMSLGISAPAFLECVRRGFETLHLRAVVLDRNEDQLWSTADELRRDYGLRAEVVDVDRLPNRRTLPLEIRRADVLVTASADDAMRRIAGATEIPLIEVAMCPDLFGEVRRLMRTERVHFVVADPRFAVKLATSLAPARGSRAVRVFVYGRDDLRAIAATAPVYLTRLARERMERDCALEPHVAEAGAQTDTPGSDARTAVALLRRVMPDARVFSEESQRALLSYIVRTNLAASVTPSGGAPESRSRTAVAR